MEFVGAFLDEEWESLSRMFSSGESPDLLMPSTGFLANADQNVADGVDESETYSFFPTDDATFDTNFYSVSQESSNTYSRETGGALFPNQPKGVANNTFESISFYATDCNINDGLMVPVFSDEMMEEFLHLKAEEMCNAQLGNMPETGDSSKGIQLKRKLYEAPGIQTQDKAVHAPQVSEEYYSPESPKKKSRVSRNAPKNKRKTSKKVIQDKNDAEEEMNGGGNRQSSSSCSSESEFSNASHQEMSIGGSTSESKGSASLNSNSKARATRGSATDPQSLYARRRRERINERLRILQNLVPSGTKVDISTMLEEAVHYVKFLQLQIKLLSSDDLWMYAPLAYNGMDIGIYQKTSPNQCPKN